jgi:hypothetical protein
MVVDPSKSPKSKSELDSTSMKMSAIPAGRTQLLSDEVNVPKPEAAVSMFESSGLPVGDGGLPVGANGLSVGANGIPVGAGGVPVGAGGLPVGAGAD